MLNALTKNSCLLIVFSAMMAAATVVGDEPPMPRATSDSLHRIEQILFEKTNAERVQAGLAPLTLSMDLVRTARKHAIWMCKTRRLEHSQFNVAENIAHNQPNSTEVIRSWMNSPGHRANILNPNYRKLGVAAYQYPTGGIYWVQQMAP